MKKGGGEGQDPTMTCLPCSGSSLPGLWCRCGCHFDGTLREARFAGESREWAPECIFAKTKTAGLSKDEEQLLEVLREMKKDEFTGATTMSVEQDDRFNELMKRSQVALAKSDEQDLQAGKKRKVTEAWWSDSDSDGEGSFEKELRYWYCGMCGAKMVDPGEPGISRPVYEACVDPSETQTSGPGIASAVLNKESGSGTEEQMRVAEMVKADQEALKEVQKKTDDADYEAHKKLAFLRTTWRTQIEDRATVEENEYQEGSAAERDLVWREVTGEDDRDDEDGPEGSEGKSEPDRKVDCDCEIL